MDKEEAEALNSELADLTGAVDAVNKTLTEELGSISESLLEIAEALKTLAAAKAGE